MFTLLHELYDVGIENEKIIGFGQILEVDEALLGRKPTYGHGYVSKVLKLIR